MLLLADEHTSIDRAILSAISAKAANETLGEIDFGDCLKLFITVCNHVDELRVELHGYSQSYQFDFGGKRCAVIFRNGACAAYSGDVDQPDITMKMATHVIRDLLVGALNSGVAHMNGEIEYKGTKNGAVKLQTIFDLFLDQLGV